MNSNFFTEWFLSFLESVELEVCMFSAREELMEWRARFCESYKLVKLINYNLYND